MRRWERFKDPWDREYAMRGALWRGLADVAPLDALLSPGARVLELGCGDGKFLRSLASAGMIAVGVDAARHGLLRARQAGAKDLAQADVRRLPHPDGRFSGVAARYVVGAMLAPDRRRALAEAWRVTSPGGIILLEEFSVEDFRAAEGRTVEERTRERNRGILTHYWTRPEVEAAFSVPPQRVLEKRWSQRTDQGPRGRAAWTAWWRKP